MLLDPTDPAHYDLMSAIRGPDNFDTGRTLKEVTTSVIRHYLGVHRSTCIVITPAEAVLRIHEHPTYIRQLWDNADDHFRTHISYAMSHILSAIHTGDEHAQQYAAWATAFYKAVDGA